MISAYEHDLGEIYPPGAHIEELLEEQCMSQADLAIRLGLSKKAVSEMINGKAPVSPTTAQALENVFKVPSHFWINLEGLYADYKAKLNEKEELQANIEWAKGFPIPDLKRSGLISKVRGVTPQTVKEILQFFAVSNPRQWELFYAGVVDSPQLSFRKAVNSQSKSVATWLRWGEVMAGGVHSPAYQRDVFKASIQEIRALIKVENYHTIAAQMQQLCLRAGVVLLFVPALTNAKVSGVTRWLSPTKPLIQLSLRYKTDDQLWFTFFHECAHILKHQKKMFVEYPGASSGKEEKEKEADTYARDMLIKPAVYQRFLMECPRPGESDILAFARQVEVPPAVVLGRLQHEKVLPFDRFNHLKVSLALSE